MIRTTFHDNPLIQAMAPQPNWTVSDTGKRPINMRHYLDKRTFKWFDAVTPEETRRQLVSLAAIDADPKYKHTNRAWHLQAAVDRVIGIDIEPSAPPDMIAASRCLPAHYAEESRHGGVHLLIQIPEALITDETRYLFNLTLIKDPDKRFEVLFNRHFITLTRKILPAQRAAGWPHPAPEEAARIGRFLKKIAALDADNRRAREAIQAAAHVDPLAPEDIPKESRRLAELLPDDFARELAALEADDYGGDTSRYEYTVAAKIAGKLFRVLHESSDPFIGSRLGKRPAEFTPADYAYATYILLEDLLPERKKHHEKREGLPWLLYLARKVSEYVTAQEKS